MSALSYFNEPAPLAWDVAAAIFGVDGVGGLYDPSSLDTLFQDANGTTPAAPGSPVGLVLDKRVDLVTEPVLLLPPVNGSQYSFDTFTTDGLDILSAIKSPSGFAGAAYDTGQNHPIGTTFRVSLDIEVFSGSAIKALFTSTANGSGPNRSDNVSLDSGTHSFFLTISSTNFGNRYLQFGGEATSYNFKLENIRIERVLNPPLSQPTTAARPILARMPKTGRRNLLTWTEDFTNAAWGKTNLTVVANATVAPDGSSTAFKIVEGVSSGSVFCSQTFPIVSGTTYTISVYAKDDGSGRVLRIAYQSSGLNGGAVFDLQNGTNTVTGGGSAAIEEVANGFFRCSWTQTATQTLNQAVYLQVHNPQQTGTAGVYVWHPQGELGTVATPYQHVRSAYDVTEEGVPDTYSLVYDLADDNLTTTLPQAINGDLLIAGTKGSIIEPVNYAAGSTFTLGPDTYTGGTPGIMRALGDIVGVVLIDRTLTQTERDVLIEHYKGKGAKGLLVPGPELVVNGGFDTNLENWEQNTPQPWYWDDGSAVIVDAPNSAHYLRQSILSRQVGKVYELSVDITSSDASVQFRLGASATSGGIVSFPAAGGHTAVLSWTGDNSELFMRVVGEGNSARINSVSLRELRAEEDWT